MKDLDIERMKYPRVSDIISKQNEAELRGIPLETLANASIRGIKIHAYCNTYLKGLFLSEIEEEYVPYVEAFNEWAETNVQETLRTSVRLYDDHKRFSGEYDAIVRLKDNSVALIDIKTSLKESRTWPVQLAAYKHLCELNGYGGIDTVYNIHLKKIKPGEYDKSGEEKVMISPPRVKAVAIEHKNLTPFWEIFTSALTCYDYFDRKGA